MKKILTLLAAVLLFVSGAIAQPTVFYTNLTSSTTPALTSNRLALTDLGAFRQCRFQTTAAPAPATQTYAFHIGTPAVPDYSTCWRPYNTPDATTIAYALNTVTVPSTVVNSARYNSGGGGVDGNLAALSNTTYYTANIQENAAADNLSAIWATSFNPVTFSGVVQAPLAGSVNPGNPVTVTFTASAAPNASEFVYVRYSINGFATSSLAQASFVATAGTAVIPGLASGANVSYYIFSSSRTAAQIAAIVGTAGIGQAGYDMATLNLENNAGANYSYTVNAGSNPITVNSSGGTPTADYGSLQTAFDAINAGTHTGSITVLVNASTTEVATSVLNASGSGAASYTNIAVNPAGGARTISGAIVAGNPLIDFNGADNVTIDGLNSGGNSLTIENTTASATSGTSTIRFIGGATSNTINRCILKGAVSSSVATNGAIVFFSTDAVTANGNDNNTISNSDIGPSGANLPTKAILGNGSTTTTAIGNSGIVINNNNIFDYFGAAVTSAGVATNGGCNTWTITNNRFYQTGTRTWTTGATHNAINLGNTTATSGAQGFTITGNIIGYASNTQTGTYTLTGSTGKFVGINFNGISLGTLSNINNNTIASVSLSGVTSSGTSTSSPFAAIMIVNGLVTTSNNTLGSQTATGSLIFSTNTTSATDAYGIYNFSVDNWVCNSNKIGGISVTNAGASGTFVIYGMRANTATTLTWLGASNAVGGTVANSIQLNATGTSSQVIGMHSSNAGCTFSLDTVRNLTTNIGTGTITSASVIGINITTATPNHSITQCSINNLSNSNATAASVVTGIQFTGGTANVMARNQVYGLTAATNSTAAELNGIRVAGGTTTYRNNMLTIGAGVSNAIGTGSTTGGINGIFEAGGTNNFYHNSVYIGGAPTAGVGPSYAFASSVTTNTRSFRDNIFFNARNNSGATGKNYIIRVGGTAPNPAGLTINNNVYYANGAGAVFGFFNSLDVTPNLGAWKTAVGQDVGSFESDPKYLDPANATPNLHIDPTVVTIIEGNGVDVGVTDDYDGQTRSGLTPTDIGADAGNFIGIDLTAPVITYTPALFTCATGDRVLSATITDVTGVPVPGSGTEPRIYYRKNAGTYFSQPGTLASGTVNNGVWNFTIVAADMGGLTLGDVVSYYIVAQDAVTPTPNISSNPAGVTTGTVLSHTAPGSPNSYTINSSIGGSFNVGTGQTYTTLTAAVAAYNISCLTGPVTFVLTDATYTGETLPIVINTNPSASAVNTLTIKPATTASISGSSAVTLLKINGGDYITIDGSNSGGTDQSLTLTNTGTGSILWIGTDAFSGANNNTLKNTIMVGAGGFAGQGIIASSGTTFGGPAEFPNSNNTIRNNRATRVQNGIFANGCAAPLDQNWQIIDNNFGSSTVADKLSFRGIFLGNAQNFTISGNTVFGVNSSTGTTSTMNGIALGGLLDGGTVVRNKIRDIKQNNTAGWGSNGIGLYATSTASNITVANNFVSDVASQGFNGIADVDNGYGIMVVSGGGYKIYSNSVSLSINQGAGAASGITGAINIAAAVTTAGSVDLRNNILSNTETLGTRYAVIDGSTAAIFSSINANDYNAQNVGFLVSAQATLANWQTATGQDGVSNVVVPAFVNPVTDLHLPPAASCVTTGKGVNIPAVTNDIDGNSRNTLPFIGAHEVYEPSGPTTTLAGTATPGATSPVSRTYLVNGPTDYMLNCNLIATITPSGGSPVSGLITSSVSVDTGATKLGTASLYLARNMDVTPATAPGSSSATVKLYFLQSEFDNYNLKAVDSGYAPLPANPTDSAHMDSVVVRQFHGNQITRNPLAYTGSSQDFPLTRNVDIFWNATNNWWELTIPVGAFSGFFVTSKARAPLPVNVEYFRGTKQGGNHLLDWKVSCTNTPSATLVLERSSDARSFGMIYSIHATAVRCLQPFSYVDANPMAGINYYRLKMIDADGKISYSSIVALTSAKKGFEFINITPNPVTEGKFKLNITSAEQLKMTVNITDVTGRVVAQKEITIIAGFNAIDMNVNNLAAGTYQLFGHTADGRTKVLQFVKQ